MPRVENAGFQLNSYAVPLRARLEVEEAVPRKVDEQAAVVIVIAVHPVETLLGVAERRGVGLDDKDECHNARVGLHFAEKDWGRVDEAPAVKVDEPLAIQPCTNRRTWLRRNASQAI